MSGTAWGTGGPGRSLLEPDGSENRPGPRPEGVWRAENVPGATGSLAHLSRERCQTPEPRSNREAANTVAAAILCPPTALASLPSQTGNSVLLPERDGWVKGTNVTSVFYRKSRPRFRSAGVGGSGGARRRATGRDIHVTSVTERMSRPRFRRAGRKGRRRRRWPVSGNGGTIEWRRRGSSRAGAGAMERPRPG